MRSIKDQMTEIRRRRGLYREKKQVRNLSILAAGMGILITLITQKYRKIDEELKGSGRHESGK